MDGRIVYCGKVHSMRRIILDVEVSHDRIIGDLNFHELARPICLSRCRNKVG